MDTIILLNTVWRCSVDDGREAAHVTLMIYEMRRRRRRIFSPSRSAELCFRRTGKYFLFIFFFYSIILLGFPAGDRHRINPTTRDHVVHARTEKLQTGIRFIFFYYFFFLVSFVFFLTIRARIFHPISCHMGPAELFMVAEKRVRSEISRVPHTNWPI